MMQQDGTKLDRSDPFVSVASHSGVGLPSSVNLPRSATDLAVQRSAESLAFGLAALAVTGSGALVACALGVSALLG